MARAKTKKQVQVQDVAERVTVTHPFVGICHMQVCAVADATDAEILAVCNSQNQSGTQLGWASVIRDDGGYQMNPVVCGDDANRKHFLVAC